MGEIQPIYAVSYVWIQNSFTNLVYVNWLIKNAVCIHPSGPNTNLHLHSHRPVTCQPTVFFCLFFLSPPPFLLCKSVSEKLSLHRQQARYKSTTSPACKYKQHDWIACYPDSIYNYIKAAVNRVYVSLTSLIAAHESETLQVYMCKHMYHVLSVYCMSFSFSAHTITLKPSLN